MFCFSLKDQTLLKRVSSPKGKLYSWRQAFVYELTYIKKGCKNENGRVVPPESLPVLLYVKGYQDKETRMQIFNCFTPKKCIHLCILKDEIAFSHAMLPSYCRKKIRPFLILQNRRNIACETKNFLSKLKTGGKSSCIAHTLPGNVI